MVYQKYGFENLEVYELAEELVLEIYNLSRQFPKEETFCLISQLHRAVISTSLNIAEGSSRKSKKDFLHFIDIAIGSLFETKSVLRLSVKLKYITEKQLMTVSNNINVLFFKLLAFKKYLARNQ